MTSVLNETNELIACPPLADFSEEKTVLSPLISEDCQKNVPAEKIEVSVSNASSPINLKSPQNPDLNKWVDVILEDKKDRDYFINLMKMVSGNHTIYEL